MKRCPTCNKTYTDPNLSFCIEDGTPLTRVVEGEQADDEKKIGPAARSDWQPAPYKPPGTYVPPGGSSQRRVWPWIVGILGVLILGIVGISIAAALILPRLVRNANNDNRRVIIEKGNSNSNENPNGNANTDSPVITNSNAADANANSNAAAPTDKDLVLAQLTDLEHEWTVANLNADKKKLGRILADDYAGPAGDGQIQGKADYLRTIQRDSSVQKWEFQNLKVLLRGDRATLTGRLILRRNSTDTSYDFTDKFVWREGRWQATGSEVTEVPTTTLE